MNNPSAFEQREEIDTNIRFKIHSPTLTQKVLIISNINYYYY